MAPNTEKAWRQERYRYNVTMRYGVRAAPQRAAVALNPSAMGRSEGGSQELNTFANPGKQPASPAPNSSRVTSRDGRFHTHPVAAVKNDHHSTMRVSTLRGPIRSHNHPLGISSSAYVSPNAENT